MAVDSLLQPVVQVWVLADLFSLPEASVHGFHQPYCCLESKQQRVSPGGLENILLLSWSMHALSLQSEQWKNTSVIKLANS